MLLRACGHRTEDIQTFGDELVRSAQPSVDAFLEHRADLLEVGKAAIAASLIPFETVESLAPAAENMRWYEYLWQQMNAPAGRFADNQLTIVTFNYDRSLEFFLFHAIQKTYGLADHQVVALLATLPIIHVHGSLGRPRSPGQTAGMSYENSLTPQRIQRAAAGIRVVHEATEPDDVFSEVHRALEQAEVVCLLGFAYHRANLQRLKLPRVQRVRLIGSAYKLPNADRMRLDRTKPKIRLGSAEQDALSYLQDSAAIVGV